MGHSLTYDPANVTAIVWGGITGLSSTVSNSGAIYDIALDSWAATTTTGAPAARWAHHAHWSPLNGGRLLIWGGIGASNSVLNNGGVYAPASNSWTAFQTVGAPVYLNSEVRVVKSVLCGDYIFFLGGKSAIHPFPAMPVMRYNHLTGNWTVMNTVPPDLLQHQFIAVWTGTHILVLGLRRDELGFAFQEGYKYDPTTDTWTAIATFPLSLRYLFSTHAWTGTEWVVWGGVPYALFGSPDYVNDGAKYYPDDDVWVVMDMTNTPDARSDAAVAYSDDELIVWGGVSQVANITAFRSDGARLDVVSGIWETVADASLTARNQCPAVWDEVNKQFVTWGGNTNGSLTATGKKYESTPISVSGVVTYNTNPAAPVVEGVTFVAEEVGQGEIATVESDRLGRYRIPFITSGIDVLVTPSRDPLEPGAVGTPIDTVDAIAVRQHFLGLITLTEPALTAADVNEDDAVNTADVVGIRQHFLGGELGAGNNAGNHVFDPEDTTYTAIAASAEDEDYNTIVLGDVTSPYAY